MLVHHLSLYTFFFYLGNRSTHLTGNFFHTCTENTSLFVFGTVQKKLHTVAKKGRSPEMTSAQSTAADPHLLHLVRFSFSINKCFHIFTFYSPSLSLSLRHTKHVCITEDDVLQSRGSRCIFHEALDAVLFMPLAAAVLFSETERRTIDSWHSDGGFRLPTKAHEHSQERSIHNCIKWFFFFFSVEELLLIIQRNFFLHREMFCSGGGRLRGWSCARWKILESDKAFFGGRVGGGGEKEAK